MVGTTDHPAHNLPASSCTSYFISLGLYSLLAADIVVFLSGGSLLGLIINTFFMGCLLAYRNGYVRAEFVMAVSYMGFGALAFRICFVVAYLNLPASALLAETFSMFITVLWAFALVFASVNMFFADPPPERRYARHAAAA
jgi:hypothetical protein